jgi:prepilin-type N-terminal cleavage/methylation domain-containing protein
VKRAGQTSGGFTLVEVMISTALGAVIMTAVLSTFVFLGRNLARLASYQSLESGSRTALAYLGRDFKLAQGVKTGTTPTETSVTLVLPAGDVTYTYDAGTRRLRRQATFGSSRDFFLLYSAACECTEFAFRYFTTTDGAPLDQVSATQYVPYSIKQIQVRFVVESPVSWSAQTRTRYAAASARHLLRYRQAPNGT